MIKGTETKEVTVYLDRGDSGRWNVSEIIFVLHLQDKYPKIESFVKIYA